MGIQVSATLDSELKPSYTVATVAAASFVCPDSDCCIWIGNAHGMTKSEELVALRNCLDHIRENATETPIGANESYAETGNTLRNGVNSAFNAAAALPEEAKVGIWYGPAFQQIPGSSISPHVKRLIEKYIETTQQAA